jgi:hypothetical protein
MCSFEFADVETCEKMKPFPYFMTLLRLFSAFVLAAVSLSCTAPHAKESITFNSDRRLVYTDELVKKRGTVHVQLGNLLFGSYPTALDSSRISFVEGLLQAKGFNIVKNEAAAEYKFSVSTSDLHLVSTPTTQRRYSVSLARFNRTNEEIIKNLGYRSIGMWNAEAHVLLNRKRNQDEYYEKLIRRLVDLYPSQTEKTEIPFSSL